MSLLTFEDAAMAPALLRRRLSANGTGLSAEERCRGRPCTGISSAAAMTIRAINPANGDVIATYDEMTPAAAVGIIADVHEAFLGWQRASFAERAAPMRKAAEILRGDAGDYARLMGSDRQAGAGGHRGGAECATACDFYAENAARFLERQADRDRSAQSCVAFNPLGVVLAVMPLELPFWQVFPIRGAGADGGQRRRPEARRQRPGLRAGDRDVFRAPAFRRTCFSVLMIRSSRVEAVIENPLVASGDADRQRPRGPSAVARKAGDAEEDGARARRERSYLVRRGRRPGTSPRTVCARGRLINSGQSCIAAKRFIAVEERSGARSRTSSSGR